MTIYKVLMWHKDNWYVAQPKSKGMYWKCGKCLRGNVIPDWYYTNGFADTCKVCGAKVERVYFFKPDGVERVYQY